MYSGVTLCWDTLRSDIYESDWIEPKYSYVTDKGVKV